MLQHLSTRPPTTRPRSPNPQPHSALLSFSSAVFTLTFPPFPFSLSPFVHLSLFFRDPLAKKRQRNPPPQKNIKATIWCLFSLTCYTCLVKRQKPLANVCLRRPKANAFGHLMAWMGPPVSCSWPVPLDAVGLRGPLPGTPLSPPLYTPTPRLHRASSSIPQQWATVTEPHCVWCGRSQTRPLFPFQKAQPSTWVIFLGICPVKYLAGAGLKGQSDGCGWVQDK